MTSTADTHGADVGQVIGVRRKVAVMVLIAHVIGLSVTGVVDTMGTTAGFSLGGAGIGLYLGGILSLPWMAFLIGLIWLKADSIDRHPFAFSTVGPLLVAGSWALLAGTGFLREVAVSAGTSALFYLLIACACRPKSHAG